MSDERDKKKDVLYKEYLEAPAYRVSEIISGALYVQPRPAPKHTRTATALGIVLGGPFHHGLRGPGGWWILDEPELRLLDQEEIVVPDLAAWRVERMPELPETAYFSLVPDWICEVLSPGTAVTDRVEKMPIYARAGVAHAWLVDPLLRTLEIYRRQGPHWLWLDTFTGDRTIRAEPFNAVDLDLGALWRGPARQQVR
jgi:Uma2 family endonuclease